MADTSDFYFVYYNNTLIKDNLHYKNIEYKIKLDRIKDNDSITVKYECDAPCLACISNLIIEDEKHITVLKYSVTGSETPIRFNVNALKDIFIRQSKNKFSIFYSNNKTGCNTEKVGIYTIVLE